jgi:phosphoesterase RecJ-like protein
LTRTAREERFPFLELDRVRRVAVVCHRNADADAYLSAYAVSRLLESLSPGCSVDIATPGGMTSLTQKLSKIFDHAVVEESESEYDLYVAVDVGDTELLKSWLTKMRTSQAVKVLIDHHPLRGGEAYDHILVDEQATSAAEIVFRLFGELGVRIDGKTAQALLEGILFDSQHLTIAGESALKAVVALLSCGADLDDARRALRSQPDYGEVVAKLKGSQRLKIFKLGAWVGVTTEVGSFQAQVARSMIFLGADIAVVGGESEGEARVSLRSSQRFFDGTKIRLGVEVAESTAFKLGGHGGGHSTAASFTCPESYLKALQACIDRVADLLSVQAQEVK